jgi:hypothetical protein
MKTNGCGELPETFLRRHYRRVTCISSRQEGGVQKCKKLYFGYPFFDCWSSCADQNRNSGHDRGCKLARFDGDVTARASSNTKEFGH